jgi:molybdopterin synthase sulfur carrier subunit
MAVTLKFIGALRDFLKNGKIALQTEQTVSLRELIKEIVKESPKLERLLVDPELEDSRPNTLIIVNGKEISALKGLETEIKDGDEVVFVPVLHGG